MRQQHKPTGLAAFTLMELIVVISIIAVLAALIFPAGAAIKRRSTIRKAQTELEQVVTAIESYKAKMGFYPPDNPGKPMLNQLYYELTGTSAAGTGAFKSLDGATTFNISDLQNCTGPGSGISGLMNVSHSGGDDASAPAQAFLKNLKPTQYVEIPVGAAKVRLLVCSVGWSDKSVELVTGFPTVNPWRYNSSSPTNNPGHFDLWVDILVGGKTNRIGNWSARAQIVP